MPKSAKPSDDWGGNVQNVVAEMSKQKQSIYVHNFRTSLGRCTETLVPITMQIRI